MLSWLSIAPFGKEVLPEVYWIRNTSSGSTPSEFSSGCSAAGRDSSAPGSVPAGRSSSPTTSTVRSSGSAAPGSFVSMAGSVARSMAMKSILRKRSAVTSSTASDCSRQ